MSSLAERLRTDLNVARKARDRATMSVLTMTVSEVRNREIELGHQASDQDVIDVVNRAIKRRREAAEQMRAGAREELAAKEDAEAVVLSAYLPPGLSEADVRTLVRDAVAAGADSMGAVMGRIMPAVKGRFDGREANRIVREELEGR
jgi:uncharacterized protein YqeY